MKKQFTFFLLLFFLVKLNAQNVGIGTATPAEKLEIKNPLRSTIKISSNSLSDTSQLIFSNRTNVFGTDFLITSKQEQGLFFTSKSDLSSNTNDSSMAIAPTGNIGIGVKSPTAKLDINGGVKIEKNNTLEFGAGIVGKEINAGKIGYNSFSTTSLDIVGAGTTATNRQIYFFAEGGSYFQGPINTNSSLQINGNSGIAGQVLTSNGNASPSWTNAAFGNSTRFSFDLLMASGSGGADIDSLRFANTNYNLNPTQIFITPTNNTRLQINKTGLYHFSGAVDLYHLNLTNPTELGAYLDYYINNKQYPIDMGTPLHVLGGGNNDYYKRFQFSFDVYLTAGQTIKFEKHFYPYVSGYHDASGYVNGYLIAE